MCIRDRHCTEPCTQFANDQRVSNNNWQRLGHQPWWLSAQHSAAPLERQPGKFIANRTTAVRTIRAYRRTSLCNSRAHSFAQLPQHLTGTSNSACTRTASSWLHTTHRNSARECHICSVVL